MKPQFNNYLLSSTVLWLDNVLLDKGEAFYNVPIRFFPIRSNFNNVYFYSSPYKQLCYDHTVSGVNTQSGVFLNGQYITTGTSGFLGINFEEGAVMFSGQLPSSSMLTGFYGVKEFNVKTISEPQERLLLENKYYRKNTPIRQTGNYTDEQPIPAIYLRLENQQNDEYALGGQESSVRNFIVTILAESQYQLDAVKSLIVDQTRCYIPLLNHNELPFDNYYRLKQPFSYTGITYNRQITGEAAFIRDITSYNFDSNLMSELRKINPDIYVGIMEIETEFIRYPRNN
jgi:hypothetical protein